MKSMLYALSVALMALAFMSLPGTVFGETFHVNTTNDIDDGSCDAVHCSLREAIRAVNANEPGSGDGEIETVPGDPGPDVIQFAILGDPPYAIIPATPLPEILDPVIVDGTTQPEPGVELDSAGLVISAGPSVVRGLTFLQLHGPGIHLKADAGGSLIEGNQIFGGQGGNFIGVLIEGTSDNLIGGLAEGQGNLIAGKGGPGIPDESRTGTGIGVELRPGGGPEATRNRIEGNRIEHVEFGVLAYGSDNAIGGLSTGAGNVIAETSIAGVVVQAGTGNAIIGNTIFSELGMGGIGIDLGLDGPTPNDPLDVDRGANELQNFPELTDAAIDSGSIRVTGSLESFPVTTYRLEFFADRVVPPGQIFLGSHTATTDFEGRLDFDLLFPSQVEPFVPVVATATDLATSDTSEFSPWLFAQPADEIAPSTSIALAGAAGHDDWFRSDVSVRLTAADDPGGSGVESIEFSLDGAAFEPYSGPFLVTGEGVHDLRARATDRAGNVETPPAGAQLRIDETKPEITVLSPEARAYRHSAMLELRFAASDALSGLDDSSPSADLDGDLAVSGQLVDLLLEPLGLHTFTLRASDLAGNESTERVVFEVIATVGSLIDAVNRFGAEGAIDRSQVAKGLLAKLYQAQDALDRGKLRVARNKLQDFIDQVESQAGRHLSVEAAQILVADARHVLSTL